MSHPPVYPCYTAETGINNALAVEKNHVMRCVCHFCAGRLPAHFFMLFSINA